MRRLVVFIVLLLFLCIPSGSASEVVLTEFVWRAQVYISPFDRAKALEMQWIIMDAIGEYIPTFKDEWGISVYCGPYGVSTRLSPPHFRFDVSIAGMFSVTETDYWQDGQISPHAVSLLKELLELICADLEAHPDVSESYPLLGKVWEGDSFWEPCDPHTKIWYPQHYYEDLVRILEYRNGVFYREYYKHTISSNPEPFCLVLTLAIVVVVVAIMRRK